ncbi:MAG: UvrB/UvrC motif-containing protein [Phycisphaerae bacterium]|nr:UvrB/UvrC motif-containing protein [Phycisphaerae bacterium]
MNCQRCKKAIATVHLTDITKHEKREKHLCERCAQEEGVTIKPQHVHYNELFTHFVMAQPSAHELAQLTCPECQTSFVEFRNTGLLGCPNDYDVFERALLPLIERAHEGQSRHVGKSPRRLGHKRDFQDDLIRLRRHLARAIEDEDYEAAARLRDEINAIETK